MYATNTELGLNTPVYVTNTELGLNTPVYAINTELGLNTPVYATNTELGLNTPVYATNTEHITPKPSTQFLYQILGYKNPVEWEIIISTGKVLTSVALERN